MDAKTEYLDDDHSVPSVFTRLIAWRNKSAKKVIKWRTTHNQRSTERTQNLVDATPQDGRSRQPAKKLLRDMFQSILHRVSRAKVSSIGAMRGIRSVQTEQKTTHSTKVSTIPLDSQIRARTNGPDISGTGSTHSTSLLSLCKEPANAHGSLRDEQVAKPLNDLIPNADQPVLGVLDGSLLHRSHQKQDASRSKLQQTVSNTLDLPSLSTSTRTSHSSGYTPLASTFTMVIEKPAGGVSQKVAKMDTGCTNDLNLMSQRVAIDLGLPLEEYHGPALRPMGPVIFPIGEVIIEWHAYGKPLTYQTICVVVPADVSNDFEIILGEEEIKKRRFLMSDRRLYSLKKFSMDL